MWKWRTELWFCVVFLDVWNVAYSYRATAFLDRIRAWKMKHVCMFVHFYIKAFFEVGLGREGRHKWMNVFKVFYHFVFVYFCNLFDLFFHCHFHVFFFSRHSLCSKKDCLFPPSKLVNSKAFWKVTFLDKLWRAWGWPIPNWLDCWNLTPQHYTFELVKFVVIWWNSFHECSRILRLNRGHGSFANCRLWECCLIVKLRSNFLRNAEKFCTGIKTIPPEYIVLWGVS